MTDSLKRVDELTKYAQQNRSLSSDQRAVLKKAKDAIAHFEEMVKDIEKHLDDSVR
jgi:ribosomal protein S20